MVKISKFLKPFAVSIAAVVVLLFVVGVCVALALPKFKKMQQLTDNLNRITRENLTGLRVVRAYNAEVYQEKNSREPTTSSPRPTCFRSAPWPL